MSEQRLSADSAKANWARLSASEHACYRWPADTTEHRAMRAAFMDGAAHAVCTEPQTAREKLLLKALEAVRFSLMRAGYRPNSIMIEGIDKAVALTTAHCQAVSVKNEDTV